eukprot:scaffold9928_cov112-Isochrysis_galbana.AAC.5
MVTSRCTHSLNTQHDTEPAGTGTGGGGALPAAAASATATASALRAALSAVRSHSLTTHLTCCCSSIHTHLNLKSVCTRKTATEHRASLETSAARRVYSESIAEVGRGSRASTHYALRLAIKIFARPSHSLIICQLSRHDLSLSSRVTSLSIMVHRCRPRVHVEHWKHVE